MSNGNMEIGPEHLALANVCINLACEVSDWPEEIQEKMNDLQRRFTLVHATLMERARLNEMQIAEEQRRQQEELSAESDRVGDAIRKATSNIAKMSTLRNSIEGVYGDPNGVSLDDEAG